MNIHSTQLIKLARGVTLMLGVSMATALAAADLELSSNQPVAATAAPDGSSEMYSKAAVASENGDTVYIVQFNNPAVATYDGGIAGLAATSARANGVTRLDAQSDASVAYANFLSSAQKAFVADCESTFGHQIDVKYQYQYALNGVAMVLSSDEAEIVASMPSVASVSVQRFETLNTDAGPQLIGAPTVHSGPPFNVPHSMGEGIVIAVLDTGINSDHPSFADIGGDGFDHTNPLGSGNYVPGSHCDTVDPSFCNDKLIGAWDFTGPADGSTPEDTDGHGSHTASTAGGNVTPSATLFAPTTSLTRDLSGVAPHANIIAYDVCIATCPTAALLAAVNQVVIDASALPNGIHALNYSISGGNDPYNDIIELGFLNATAAGIFVSTSAGNNGPGAATTGHNSPWVSATAALTHNRQLRNSVVNLNSDSASLPDIAGLGFTAGFGPAPIINSADLEGAFPGSTLCGLGTIGSNIPPWPAGTFNGEIVACTRGTFGRVEKGANVLAAGAGGYILMDNGAGLVGDAHVLPGVHITQADGATLAAWLASNSNPVGTINGVIVDLSASNADVMAGFSSRGPNSAIDVIKPDSGAPGVSIFAAEANGQAPAPEYQFLSGTSMASPHNAGSGALLSGARPDWSPYAIKSALMMTATRFSTLKEDGATPTDHFDVGAGRINVDRALEAGLILDESPANFAAANPALGGDPRTVNIASMQDGNCVGACSWTRTVTNVTGHHSRWDLSTETTGNTGLALSVSPGPKLKLDAGESRTLTVTADTALAANGWNFAELQLQRDGDGPDLHMPIAIQVATSSDANLFNKTVDKTEATDGDILSYEINITNGGLTNVIDMSDSLPSGLDFVSGSLSELVTGGATISPLSFDGSAITWSGTLNPGGVDVVANPNSLPFGIYVPLPAFGVPPLGCSSVCDDTSISISGLPAFTFGGATFSNVVMGSNGIAIPGTDATNAFTPVNQSMPNVTPPNGMAPFWTDLDLDGTSATDSGAGSMYIATFNSGALIVMEWAGVEVFGLPGQTFSFQIQILTNQTGAPQIWYAYQVLPFAPASLTIGAENNTGGGNNFYFNGSGTFPSLGNAGALSVIDLTGGSATFTFQAEVDSCTSGEAIVNRANISSAGTAETAIAATKCTE